MTGFDSIDRLFAKAGEAISATKKWNPLVREVFRKTLRRGGGVRLKEYPSQTMVGFSGSVPTVIDYRFRVEVGGSDVRVGFGLVAGHEPRIEVEGKAVPISKVDDETGETPALTLQPEDFARGRALLFAKVNLSRGWAIETVDIVARPEVPAPEPWTGYKLIAVLRQDAALTITALQMVYFNLNHGTSLRRTSGLAKHWFWAT